MCRQKAVLWDADHRTTKACLWLCGGEPTAPGSRDLEKSAEAALEKLQEHGIALVCGVTPLLSDTNPFASQLCDQRVLFAGGDTVTPFANVPTATTDGAALINSFVGLCLSRTAVHAGQPRGQPLQKGFTKELRNDAARLHPVAVTDLEQLVSTPLAFGANVTPVHVDVEPPYQCEAGVRFMRMASNPLAIAKDFQHAPNDSLARHELMVRGSMIARRLAQRFCNALERGDIVKYVQSYIVEVDRPKISRFFTVEEGIGAGAVTKYNTNAGVVLNDSQKLQAFSHYTYHATAGKLMVLDVQGIRKTELNTKSYVLCNPAITTPNPADFPTATNLGVEAMHAFLKMHVCSGMCLQLGLPTMNDGVEL
jgi:hypothetical protein